MSATQFGFTILYAKDPKATIEFYEKAFGLQRRFFEEKVGYGELETGATTLVISSIELERKERKGMEASTKEQPSFGFHISFIKDDVEKAYKLAIENGAEPVLKPKQMQWGGTVGFVRDINGILVSLVTPKKS